MGWWAQYMTGDGARVEPSGDLIDGVPIWRMYCTEHNVFGAGYGDPVDAASHIMDHVNDPAANHTEGSFTRYNDANTDIWQTAEPSITHPGQFMCYCSRCGGPVDGVWYGTLAEASAAILPHVTALDHENPAQSEHVKRA